KEKNIGLTFKQKLKALPDVVTDPASKKSFLKRLGPSWEEDDADEDHAERLLAADDVNQFGDAPPSPFDGTPYLRRLGAADQEVLMAVFTADEDDDDDDDGDYEPLGAMVPFAGGGGLQTRREEERASHARNDGTLRMVGGDDDELKSDGEIVSVRREPKFKRAKIAALRSGRGTEEQRKRNVKMAAKKMFEEYSALGFKGPDETFGSASEAQSFDEARACIASCYHLYALAESERRFGPEILYQCSCPQFWHYGKTGQVPAIYAIEKIGVNRKTGRPSKANGGDALRRI
ncbi:hypothetical protein M885DRAFT_573537, partial [Pelagophyceae sp. CCMP2097]